MGWCYLPSVRGPEGIEAGQRVVLAVTPGQNARELAGEFGSFVGTRSEEEASEMQQALDDAFETISDEW